MCPNTIAGMAARNGRMLQLVNPITRLAVARLLMWNGYSSGGRYERPSNNSGISYPASHSARVTMWHPICSHCQKSSQFPSSV